jgi:isopropylmalate/homocitrate/citramalate synthase
MVAQNLHFKSDIWGSPLNYDPELRSRYNLQRDIYINDVTLRDGEQTPGVAFTTDEKILIAEELDQAGVATIELGIPVVPKDFKAMQVLTKRRMKARLVGLVRAIREDIIAASNSGLDSVILEHSINPYTCKFAYGMEEKDLITKNIEMIRFAKEQGLWVNWMGWDAFRHDPAYVERVFRTVVGEGNPEAVTIADTFGMAHPLAVFDFFQKMRKWFPGKMIEYHAHNDMGCATANALSAITGGANSVHTAVNGLGERAGNISLEEIATVLKACHDIDCGVDLSRLSRLSKLVEQISKRKNAENKPIVGEKLFVVDSGLIMHIFFNAAKNDFPQTIMLPFLPEKVGHSALEYVIGKGIGKATVDYFLGKLGIELREDQIARVAELVKEEATLRKSYLTVDEFKELLKKL